MHYKTQLIIRKVKGLGPAERAGYVLGAGAAAAVVAGGARAHPVVVAIAGVLGAYAVHKVLEHIEAESPQAEALIEAILPLLEFAL